MMSVVRPTSRRRQGRHQNPFGGCVQVRGRFIQNQDGSVLEDGAAMAEPLTFAAA